MLFNLIIDGPVAAGTIISAGTTWETADFNRRIARIGLVGGENVGEVELDVSYGTQHQMVLVNLSVGEPSPEKFFWDTSKIYCPRNTPIVIEVKKAIPSGKRYVLTLDIKRV
jgi:hypothetical protein